MRLAATLLQDLGFLLYAGPLIAMAILIALCTRISGLPDHAAVRTYRAWGPGLGLSLGACIVGTVLGHWLDHGSFDLGPDTPARPWMVAVYGVFLASWVSNIKLEIWTLEPLRKLDSDAPAPPPDAAAYSAATTRLSRHMMLHAGLLLTVAVLEITRRTL